jgi:hypothetical protein
MLAAPLEGLVRVEPVKRMADASKPGWRMIEVGSRARSPFER